MIELDNLFDLWEQRHLEAKHKRFIRDGIVDEMVDECYFDKCDFD